MSEEDFINKCMNIDSDVRSHNVGNSNYSKLSIQPWDTWEAWHLNPLMADVVKRVARTKKEPGMTMREARKMDCEKMIHDLQEQIRIIDAGLDPWNEFTDEVKK